jgi:signal peptidase I
VKGASMEPTFHDTFTGKPIIAANDVRDEFSKLQNLIGDIVENKARYEKEAPKGPGHSFHTTA